MFDAAPRLAYAPSTWSGYAFRPTLYFDLFQIGDRRTAIHYDQLHFFSVDDQGTPIDPNPHYRRAELFQPPTSARLGLSFDFGALD